MNPWHPFSPHIDLFVRDRISEEDAKRQEVTAREVLNRLTGRPGAVLADEVGMGKTFVALAVAASVATSDPERRPVVVMVPPSLKEKWPQDFAVFREKCIRAHSGVSLSAASADTGLEFLKLLDDPPERRKTIIFLTHGAMCRKLGWSLTDKWVKLAIIHKALAYRRNTASLRRALSRCLGQLMDMKGLAAKQPDLWERLLDERPKKWLRVLRRLKIDPEGDNHAGTDDDPVPAAILDALHHFDSDPVFKALESIPMRNSRSYPERVRNARKVLHKAIGDLWDQCFRHVKIRLPLLILDEAHHLKNARTQLAGLFQIPDADEDADQLTRGRLAGVFERMLFLTATPFQLGHSELCSVLERFDGIDWSPESAPSLSKAGFHSEIADLRERLDRAEQAALALDAAWGQLGPSDLVVGERRLDDVNQWWRAVLEARGFDITRQKTAIHSAGVENRPSALETEITVAARRVRDAYERARVKMKEAERALQPWVIRHLKPASLPLSELPRRYRHPGARIVDNAIDGPDSGLEISQEALLPFLLAARATFCAPDRRPVFAEGLASCYEAFFHTRKAGGDSLDFDDDPGTQGVGRHPGEWYLRQLESLVPLGSDLQSSGHPKVAATLARVKAAWRRGEKVLVFCHFIATGRTLRRLISSELKNEIRRLAADRIHAPVSEIDEELRRLGDRFFKEESVVRRVCDRRVTELIERHEALGDFRDSLVEVSRRYIRTPSFLARYFPLEEDRLTETAIDRAFGTPDESGMTLREVLENFFDFLEKRCSEDERRRYIEAISHIQTGDIRAEEAPTGTELEDNPESAQERLLPNVRLVNGATKQETRQRLMLSFNSPFFPEVLVASSVMAEGVDLHRFCRYVIHHDLCWNPSTLEQRTGRLDRIGAKAEQCRRPIRVYLPYIAETQDEKQYRVVMDRDRWFNVVMGEKFKIQDLRTIEKLADRIPLAESVANELAFDLRVVRSTGQSG